MTLKIAAIQVRTSDSRNENLNEARSLIELAVREGAQIVVMPEIFSAPFVSGEVNFEYFKWAERLDGPTNTMMAQLSQTHGVTIVSSFFEQSDISGVYFNTAVTFHMGEPVSTYRKSHLPFSNAFPEKFYFRAGGEPPRVARCGDVSVGTIICYERHFPELGRLVALAGGEVMAVPVACASVPTREIFQIELRAQAIFNELFVICANRVGLESDKLYYGTSAIYGPDGSILAQGSTDSAEVVLAEVNIDEVRSRRQVLPFLRDRRPDLYGGLIADLN